ncbi:MAG: outer membrane lipoprotein-sorting protein [bacterium]|nr:outer membrane lipoprotein-sorting protein [bacterium]
MKKLRMQPTVTFLFLFPFLLLLFSPMMQWGQEAAEKPGKNKAEAKVKEIVKKMDELYRSRSSSAKVEMEITTPHWKRTLKMDMWSLGMDKTFIRILSPKKEKGIATLRIGNEMWNFLPKTNKVMKIPPSMMMGSWMGSDFTNDDLVKEFTFVEDFTFEMTTVENAQPGMLYIKCIPKEGRPIVWGHVTLAVKENDYIPLWYKYYDEKGKLMREMLYKEERVFSGRRLPAVMELVPTHKKGNKTVVRYLEAQFDNKVDKAIFSLRNLRDQ